MPTLDLKRQYSALYKPSAKVATLVEVPSLRFLMIDGVGGIGGSEFQGAIQALFSMAYSTKFEARKKLDLTYPVMALEGLYWDPESETPAAPPSETAAFAWTLMIMLPDPVPAEFVDEVRTKVASKKDLPRLGDVRVQTFTEGPSVQIMHIGPYSEETPTIERLLAFADERGFEVTGRHHEIYLGDPRRSAPEKLKTVLRYGVRRRR